MSKSTENQEILRVRGTFVFEKTFQIESNKKDKKIVASQSGVITCTVLALEEPRAIEAISKLAMAGCNSVHWQLKILNSASGNFSMGFANQLFFQNRKQNRDKFSFECDFNENCCGHCHNVVLINTTCTASHCHIYGFIKARFGWNSHVSMYEKITGN